MSNPIGEPGQELNLSTLPGQSVEGGRETPPRQAATVILLRGGDDALEVLLVKRTEKARFMGGVWVFPGGALDRADGSTKAGEGSAHRMAAARELAEEASVTIADPQELIEFSRWITPAQVTVRFDTRFFLAELPAGQEAEVDGEECVEHGWFTPREALDAHARGKIALVFPTIKHLERLDAFSTVAELLDYAGGREVLPVQPKVSFDGEVARVLLPGEPGYDD
ncbi:MAG TPA: NUDIX domain-containing protein [Solirubrobacteraceae bacterium]|jgi:8-oxo-dGTP pyrophosphatase MutT (NUDIX family)|nr:NUDIX domain-containing protein [Solirubrobacteraceae bacterium]